MADYSINRHYLKLPKKKNKYLEFLKLFVTQISLISKWMSIGFIHGVMNTDNMTISGETIDYGLVPLWTDMTQILFLAQ